MLLGESFAARLFKAVRAAGLPIGIKLGVGVDRLISVLQFYARLLIGKRYTNHRLS